MTSWKSGATLGTPGRVGRAIPFTAVAWDVSYQPHVRERYSRRQVAPVVEALHERIAGLEAGVQRLRTKSPADSQ